VGRAAAPGGGHRGRRAGGGRGHAPRPRAGPGLARARHRGGEGRTCPRRRGRLPEGDRARPHRPPAGAARGPLAARGGIEALKGHARHGGAWTAAMVLGAVGLGAAPSPRASVLLITVDTLRPDALGWVAG